MRCNNKRVIILGLLCSFFLLVTISCSTMKDFWGWAGFNAQGKASSDPEDMKSFFSNVRSHQGNPDSHYLLGCYYQERGKYREALEEFKKVLLIDPHYVRAYNGMGVSYDLLGDFPRATESYEMALNLNPGLDYVQNNLGYSYFLQGDLDEAEAILKKAIALNEQNRQFHNNLGLIYAEKGQFDLAMVEFQRGGDEAWAHYNIAQFYFRKGMYGEAKNHYTVALGLNPSFTLSRTGLEAANALARVLGSADPKTIPEQFVISAQPLMWRKE
jgi:tetratricopeptide (TPR) repeat protein